MSKQKLNLLLYFLLPPFIQIIISRIVKLTIYSNLGFETPITAIILFPSGAAFVTVMTMILLFVLSN